MILFAKRLIYQLFLDCMELMYYIPIEVRVLKLRTISNLSWIINPFLSAYRIDQYKITTLEKSMWVVEPSLNRQTSQFHVRLSLTAA